MTTCAAALLSVNLLHFHFASPSPLVVNGSMILHLRCGHDTSQRIIFAGNAERFVALYRDRGKLKNLSIVRVAQNPEPGTSC